MTRLELQKECSLTLIQKNNENGKVQIMRRYDKPVRMTPQRLSSPGAGSTSVKSKMINNYILYSTPTLFVTTFIQREMGERSHWQNILTCIHITLYLTSNIFEHIIEKQNNFHITTYNYLWLLRRPLFWKVEASSPTICKMKKQGGVTFVICLLQNQMFFVIINSTKL